LLAGLEKLTSSSPRSSKASVGIPVPGNPNQKMYVWCDALSNYISALGFGTSHDDLYKKYWDSESAQNLHVIGKDILRFHTAIWPGMLLSAGLPLPKKILVHGFITSDGKKMSKSLGNVIDPDLLIKEYGGEAVRYYLARHISPFEDGDITLDKFKEVYNANLANGLGNLVSRVMKMAETYLDQPVKIPENTIPESFFESLEHFDVQKSADVIWYKITELDETIQRTAPFKLVKVEKEKALKIIEDLVLDVYTIARMLNPIMPLTMEKIKKAVKENKMPSEPLFARKN
jgi:methionyl-tRNA synthetase